MANVLHVPLYTKGVLVAHAVIDEEDVEHAGYLWHFDAQGYPARTIDGVWQRLHRVLMGLGAGDGQEVDHLDGDKLNNQRSNLIIATRAENCQNVRTARDLPRGVYRAPWGRFYAQVKHCGVKHSLGHYDTPDEASEVAARKRKELGFHESRS